MADGPFYEAAFNARLADTLLGAGYGIRRTDRDFEFASVTRLLIEKLSKRTREIEQLAKEQYTVLYARARALVAKTGIEYSGHGDKINGLCVRSAARSECDEAAIASLFYVITRSLHRDIRPWHESTDKLIFWPQPIHENKS